MLYAYLCTDCAFDAQESFTRADQHEYETGHLVALQEVATNA